MGLSIKKYNYSYSRLHQLRRAALKVEGNNQGLMCLDAIKKEDFSDKWEYYAIVEGGRCGKCFYCNPKKTKFESFLQHSDCEGGYRSINGKTKKSKFVKIKPESEEYWLWGHPLEKLKKECAILEEKIRDFLPEDYWLIWDDFHDDVKSSRRILEFN